MSPSPDRLSQSPKSSTPSQPPPDEPSSEKADAPSSAASDNSAVPATDPANSSESTPLVPKRPLMRPVNRPQPPTPSPVPEKPAQKPTVVSLVTPAAPTTSTPAPVSSLPDTGYPPELAAANRMQPIPPPSEPKQYRAIGLVRGCYTPSEEQFTRGTMLTTDGTAIEAVLLGRVMSLVRNHLDLTDNHLWVVYPRTRDIENNLHVQIVGVWEPEKLNRKQDASEDEEVDVEPTPAPLPSEPDGSISPGYEDDYFSIRGEVVFYAPEEQSVVIKIQQAARKGDDKAKAFKLKLTGTLDSPKTLGYFWELHVKRQATALVITSGTAIGLVPPKKNPKKGGPRRERRSPPGRPRDIRPGGSRPPGPATAVPAPRREAIPKPTKRNPQSSEG